MHIRLDLDTSDIKLLILTTFTTWVHNTGLGELIYDSNSSIHGIWITLS